MAHRSVVIIPTSPSEYIFSHIALMQNSSLPFTPFTIFLKKTNKIVVLGLVFSSIDAFEKDAKNHP